MLQSEQPCLQVYLPYLAVPPHNSHHKYKAFCFMYLNKNSTLPFLWHSPLAPHHNICKHSLKTLTFFAYVPSTSLLKCLNLQLPYHSSAYLEPSPHLHNQVQLQKRPPCPFGLPALIELAGNIQSCNEIPIPRFVLCKIEFSSNEHLFHCR